MSFQISNIQTKKANFLENTAFVNALSGAKSKSQADVLATLNAFSKDGFLDTAAIQKLVSAHGEAWNPKHYDVKSSEKGISASAFSDAICTAYVKDDIDYTKYGCMSRGGGAPAFWEAHKPDLDNAFVQVGAVRHFLFPQPKKADNGGGYVKDDWQSQP